MVADFANLATMPEREKNKAVKEMGRKYVLAAGVGEPPKRIRIDYAIQVGKELHRHNQSGLKRVRGSSVA